MLGIIIGGVGGFFAFLYASMKFSEYIGKRHIEVYGSDVEFNLDDPPGW